MHYAAKATGGRSAARFRFHKIARRYFGASAGFSPGFGGGFFGGGPWGARAAGGGGGGG
jgi:hypothetical protein